MGSVACSWPLPNTALLMGIFLNICFDSVSYMTHWTYYRPPTLIKSLRAQAVQTLLELMLVCSTQENLKVYTINPVDFCLLFPQEVIKSAIDQVWCLTLWFCDVCNLKLIETHFRKQVLKCLVTCATCVSSRERFWPYFRMHSIYIDICCFIIFVFWYDFWKFYWQ